MKMKEVLKATGLTDRAVRLYIEKELVCPENEKSYTGRNNLNFSEKDVELLKKIATLRKAGFSISQIQNIQSDSEQAQLALNELLDTKEKEQELNKKVIDALSPLRGRDGLNIDMISDSLENSVREAKVPKADLKQSTGEFIERIVFIVGSGLGLLLNLLPALLLSIYFIIDFNFIKFYSETILYVFMVIALIPTIMLAVVLILHIKPKHTEKKRKIRRIISCVLLVLSYLSALTISPLAYGMLCFIPPVYSQTSNPSNYLILDNYVEDAGRDDILDLFPDYIPHSAVIEDEYGRFTGEYPDTTKYYYLYEDQIDPNYDIVAEWQLPEEEYEKAKKEIFNRDDEIIETETKGDWQLVHFTEDINGMITHSYYFVIFAYNDDTNTVRYIVSYCMDTADGAYQPYYYSLDW